MELVAQFVPLNPELGQFVSELLDFTEFALKTVVLAVTFLGLAVEFELFDPDFFLNGCGGTFLLMMSSMRELLFFSRSLNCLMSGLGRISDFLGRAGICVFSSMRSALYSYSFFRSCRGRFSRGSPFFDSEWRRMYSLG